MTRKDNMNQDAYCYQFSDSVTSDEVESTLLLAVMGVESLYGESQVRLDAVHQFDWENHQCSIDASTDVGRSLNQLFAGYLMREFPGEAFEVRRSLSGLGASAASECNTSAVGA
jgi:hypothetical protein